MFKSDYYFNAKCGFKEPAGKKLNELDVLLEIAAPGGPAGVSAVRYSGKWRGAR
jgi:hypothetical protein